MSATPHRPTKLIGSLCVILIAVGVGSAGAASAAAPNCRITWGSLPEAIRTGTDAPLRNVRSGRHECFDRVVFDLDGPTAGYRVEYVPEVRSDGEGRRLTVAGGAILRVVLDANVFDQLGHLHYSRAVGDHVAAVGRYRTLRDVVYGGCFEGRTTFAVGVRARLPFRVLSLAGPGSGSRIVLDVAHRW